MQSDDIKPADGYAGDISPQVAFQWMQSGQCALVDVRTDAEREWVGFVPGAYAVAWKQWPGMAPNANFEQEIRAVCDKAGVSVWRFFVVVGCARLQQQSSRPILGSKPSTSWRALKGTPISPRTADKRADGEKPVFLGNKIRKTKTGLDRL